MGMMEILSTPTPPLSWHGEYKGRTMGGGQMATTRRLYILYEAQPAYVHHQNRKSRLTYFIPGPFCLLSARPKSRRTRHALRTTAPTSVLATPHQRRRRP
jgi:hypothetical protein